MSRFGLVIKRVKEKPTGIGAIVPHGFMLGDGTTCMIFRKNLQLFIYDMTKERWYEIVSKPYEPNSNNHGDQNGPK